MSGIEMANWNWKVVRQFVSKRFGIGLSRSTCLNYLHRLGFVLKRPKKRLVKADEAKREAFVAEYATLSDEAWRTGAKIFFADEAHFRADAELRGKWVLRGEPALVDSTSPSYGEKASYYSAVRLDLGDFYARRFRGDAHLAMGEYDLAVADCETALDLADPDEAAHFFMALAHLQAGRLDLAIKSFDSAVERSPDSGRACYGRALAKELAGDAAGSEHDYRLALELGFDQSS